MSTTTKNLNLIKPALDDVVDITAMNENWDKIDEKLSETNGVNPNLLDNWYFLDPINQRAKTSYSGTGYTVDRWTMIESDGTVALSKSGTTIYRQLRQYLENPNDLFGKQVTASVLTSDGTLHTGTATPQTTDGGQLIIDNDNIHLYFYVVMSGTTVESISFIIECRDSVTLQAAKVEFGDKQTLAKEDTDGKWVLNNTPPNKTLETLKCNSSTDDVTDDYANHPIPKYYYGSEDLTAGSTPLETGSLYFVYE